MQVLFSLILASSVLLCPLKCMGALEFLTGQNAASTGCRCCAKHVTQETSGSKSPERDGQEDCECPLCLCHGAVVTSMVDLDQHLEHFECYLPLVLADIRFEAAPGLLVRADESLVGIGFESGASARIAMHSLLL